MRIGGDEGHPNHHLRILRDAKGIKIHEGSTKGAPNPDVSIGVYTSIRKGAKKTGKHVDIRPFKGAPQLHL